MPYTVPAALRGTLSAIAEAFLPLQDWIAKKKYTPNAATFIPSLGPLPWRDGAHRLDVDSLELIRGFEAWVGDDDTNEVLSPRWLMLKENPTAFFLYPGQSSEQWRVDRGLSAKARFAPLGGTSANMSYVLKSPGIAGDSGDAVTRATFYDECFAALLSAIDASGGISDWNAFSHHLFDGTAANWPSTARVSAPAFARRFACDLLIVAMNQRNPALSAGAPIWLRAIQVEVGENRHRGNEYRPSDVANAVFDLIRKIDALPQ